MKDLKILIVDDNREFTILLCRYLKRLTLWNAECVTCHSVKEAEAKSSMLKPDIAIIDYILKDVETGTDLILNLKKSGCRAAFILLTGVGGEQAIIEAIKAGASDYLSKRDLSIEILERTIHHVLERKKADDVIQLERDRLNSILQSMQDGVYIVDQAYKIEYINPVIEKEFGPINGRKCYEYFHGRTDTCPSCQYKEVLDGKVPQGEFYSQRNHKTYDLISTSFTNLDGSISKLGICRDITDRKKSEVELKESEKRFRMFSDASLEGIVISENGILLETNKRLAEIVCYDQKELLGKKATELVSQERQEDVMEKMLSNYDKAYETTFKRKDGSTFPVEVCGKPIMFHGRKARITSIRDLSERKRAEEEKLRLLNSLKQSQKVESIGTLAGGIAHDFNNILTPIIGYAELNLGKFPLESKTYADLKRILDSGLRARDLITQILTFSRQQERTLSTVSLAPIVREALKFMRSSLPTNIEIRQNLDDQSGTIQGDATQIHQIIMNFCVNAEHAMREKGGVLEVNLKPVHLDSSFCATHFRLKEGDYLKLTVSDTGHGISKAIMCRMFDPFFTTKVVGEGTGMGLSNVHGIVLSHGGDIIVDSEPGKGTTFDIYLPKSEDIEIEEKPKSLTIPRGNERILFVDDEDGVAKFGQDMLASLGYEVLLKTNSLEALEIFKNDPNNFDLVITDQTMPNMTGDVFAKELMKIRPETPVILCTGFSHAISAKKAQSIGIQEFIMKPFVNLDIAQLVRKVLDRDKNKKEEK